MSAEVKLKTTTGMLVDTDEYNSLMDARNKVQEIPDGIAITVIWNGKPCGLYPPKSATLHAVCMAARYLLNSSGSWRMELRTVNGVLLETPRTLEDVHIKDGDRLFLSLYLEPGDKP